MSSDRVIINDVGPRDGLQNQPKILTPAERLQMINALVDARLPSIEVGAFVHPKAVPAMANSDAVIAGLVPGGSEYNALIPNRKGYELAKATGIKTMSLVTAASNTMNEKNINMNNAEAMAVCRDVIAQGKQDGISIMAYVATAWECPFEGLTDFAVVEKTTAQLFDAGADRVVISDTIGAAHPGSVRELFKRLNSQFDVNALSAHFHDTRGMGLANVLAAMECDIRLFDASVGGLGGCPFAPGATGNVATEDVVLMLHKMGITTGIDLEKLVTAVETTKTLTGTCKGGHSFNWLSMQVEKGATL